MESRDSRLKEICTQCGKSYAAGTKYCPVDKNELMSTIGDPLIGALLPRRYRILSLLGRGSMSVVYKGVHEPLDQTVAVKMLKAHMVSDPQQAKRFQQEIKTVGTLNHPNIVGILDFGVTEQDVPYLIMEYLEGRSLAEILDSEERLSVNRAIKLFSQAADALAYAHGRGFVHRDVKPSNLLVCGSGDRETVKLVDFGIAKILSRHDDAPGNSDSELTTAGEILGTPLYMSPEQANGRELDWRSDIYALGCVMYHAITGTPPFVGDTAIDTIRLQATAEPAAIDQARPDLYIPERLKSVIAKALQKDPRLRYQRMEYLNTDLHSCQRRPEAPTRSGANPSAGANLTSSNKAAGRQRNYEPLNFTFIAVAVLAIGFAVGAYIHSLQKHHSTPIVQQSVTDNHWQQTLSDAQSAFYKGNYDSSSTFFEQAVSLAKPSGSSDAQLAATLIGQGTLFNAQGKYADAERVLKKALSSHSLADGNSASLESKLDAVDALIALTHAYCNWDKVEQADACAQKAAAILEAAGSKDESKSVEVLQCEAAAASMRKDYLHADDLLTKALFMSDKQPDNELQTAAICHDLGVARNEQGMDESAEVQLDRALSTRERRLGASHPAVADTLCALGTLELNSRKDASAETMFKNALNIRLTVFGPNTPAAADVYTRLGEFYATQGNRKEAELYYRKALPILATTFGAHSPRYKAVNNSLAALLKEQRKAH